MLGLIILTVPTIQYGGYFLLSQMGKSNIIILAWVVRIGTTLAPVFISAGFFGGAPAPDTTTPRPLIRLIYVGVAALAIGMVTLGMGLIFA